MDLVMSIGDGYGGKSIDEYRDRARDGLLSAPTPPLAHELVGRRCVKEFADHGVFEGIVESFDPGSPDGQGPLGYKVRYTDGDCEHLSLEDLRSILVPSDGDGGASARARAKNILADRDRDASPRDRAATRLLGEFSQAQLRSWPARELKRRYCDVFDAPVPPSANENERWLRAKLAPHASDEARAGEFADADETDDDDDEAGAGGRPGERDGADAAMAAAGRAAA